MDKKKEVAEINEELARRKGSFPFWIIILIVALVIGIIFRNPLANIFKNEKKPANNDIYTIKWEEPSTLIYEEANSGKLENTLKDHSILIDGTYYHLPCSIYQFVKNGWTVDIAGNNSNELVYTIPADKTKVVALNKKDKVIKVVSVASPINEEVSISESFVTGLSIFSWSEFDAELPKGLKIGTKKEEIERLIKEEDLSYDVSKLKKDNVYEIIIENEEDLYEEYEIKLVMKDDIVDQIRVEVIYKKP